MYLKNHLGKCPNSIYCEDKDTIMAQLKGIFQLQNRFFLMGAMTYLQIC